MENPKFKVGDSVQIVKNETDPIQWNSDMNKYIGQIHIISSVDDSSWGFHYNFEKGGRVEKNHHYNKDMNGWYWFDHMLTNHPKKVVKVKFK